LLSISHLDELTSSPLSCLSFLLPSCQFNTSQHEEDQIRLFVLCREQHPIPIRIGWVAPAPHSRPPPF
jgi:hypothetical protein